MEHGNGTQAEVRGYVAAGVAAVQRLERFADGTATAEDAEYIGVGPEDLADGLDCDPGAVDFFTALAAVAPDATAVSEWSLFYEPTRYVTAVRLLLAGNGPTIRATYDVNGNVDIVATWGGATATGYVYAPATAAALHGMAGGEV